MLHLWPALLNSRTDDWPGDWPFQEHQEVKSLEAEPGSGGPRGPRGCWAVVVSKEEESEGAGVGQLGIDEGDGDVPGAPRGGEPLVVVREPPGVHEGPALPWGSDGAVVAQEATAPSLGERSVSVQDRAGPSPRPATQHSPVCPLFSPTVHSQVALGTAGLGMPCRVTDTSCLRKTGQRLRDGGLWPRSQAARGKCHLHPFLTVVNVSFRLPPARKE